MKVLLDGVIKYIKEEKDSDIEELTDSFSTHLNDNTDVEPENKLIPVINMIDNFVISSIKNSKKDENKKKEDINMFSQFVNIAKHIVTNGKGSDNKSDKSINVLDMFENLGKKTIKKSENDKNTKNKNIDILGQILNSIKVETTEGNKKKDHNESFSVDVEIKTSENCDNKTSKQDILNIKKYKDDSNEKKKNIDTLDQIFNFIKVGMGNTYDDKKKESSMEINNSDEESDFGPTNFEDFVKKLIKSVPSNIKEKFVDGVKSGILVSETVFHK